MSATFFHGVQTNHVPTSILTPKKSLSALAVILGCAPIHRLSDEAQKKVAPGKIGCVSTLAEAGALYGIDTTRDDFADWTLSEAAYVYLQIFGVAPLIFINLFDPTLHRDHAVGEAVTFASGTGQLAHPDVIGDLTLTASGGGTAFVENTDYYLNRVTGEITILDDGAMTAVTDAVASYAYAAPDKVTADDCIGGYDIVTGQTKGISLIDDVHPKYTWVPTIGLAPKLGENPGVAAVLAAKMNLVNGVFKKGAAIVDVPSDGENGVTLYSEVPSYKKQNGLTSESMTVCWPKVTLGERVVRLSVVASARMALTDVEAGGIPFVSPSNKEIHISGLVAGGEEVWLDLQKVNLLDSNGIVSALNFGHGWRLWGNHTAAYPGSSDPKEYFIPIRRMVGWYNNLLVVNYWGKIDFPLGRVLIDTIINTEQYYLNSLTSSGVIHGGDIKFLESENSLVDLMGGQIAFHVYLGLASPTERIVFNIEYDPTYIQAIFSGLSA